MKVKALGVTVWKFIARLRGFQEGCDVEDNRLIIFHEQKSKHFYSWKEAALSL